MLTRFWINFLQYSVYALIISGCLETGNANITDEMDTSSSGESMTADTATETNPGTDSLPTDDTSSPDAAPSSIDDTAPDDTAPDDTAPDDTAPDDTEEKETDSAKQLESCVDTDAYRCVEGDNAAREQCTGGVWVAAASCANGEVCDITNSKNAGSCVSEIIACRDRPYETICEGAVMHLCGERGTSLRQTECSSAQHCDLGLIKEVCALCLPGDYECIGKQLRACNSTGTQFENQEQCETEGLCNATAGACTDKACEQGSYNCEENKLFKCNDDQTAFEEVAAADQCNADEICDEKNGECDICRAIDEKETKSCVPEEIHTVLTCSDDGQETEKEDCPEAGYCIDEGKCVECIAEAHCADKVEQCVMASCNDNKCVTNDIEKGEPCIGVGVCDSKGGKCVDCTKDEHCTDSYCLPEENKCVACREDVHCAATNKLCDEKIHECAFIYRNCNLRPIYNYCAEGFCLKNNDRYPSYCGNACLFDGEECDPGTGTFEEYKGICINIDPLMIYGGDYRCYFNASGEKGCPPGLTRGTLAIDNVDYDNVCLRPDW